MSECSLMWMAAFATNQWVTGRLKWRDPHDWSRRGRFGTCQTASWDVSASCSHCTWSLPGGDVPGNSEAAWNQSIKQLLEGWRAKRAQMNLEVRVSSMIWREGSYFSVPGVSHYGLLINKQWLGETRACESFNNLIVFNILVRDDFTWQTSSDLRHSGQQGHWE